MTNDTDTVCFVDTETTGLDPDRHEIWEIGLILPDGTEHEWQLPVDLSRADPMALQIGQFHSRYKDTWRDSYDDSAWVAEVAREFVALTRGLHLCGAVVSFDAERLWRFLRAAGECPMWHYHLIDVEALAVGYLRGLAKGISSTALGVLQANALNEATGDRVPHIGQFDLERMNSNAWPPWKSDDLSQAVGVNPNQFDRHTALGDARWAKAIYEKVQGIPSEPIRRVR